MIPPAPADMLPLLDCPFANSCPVKETALDAPTIIAPPPSLGYIYVFSSIETVFPPIDPLL
jgi:hypothetical protein